MLLLAAFLWPSVVSRVGPCEDIFVHRMYEFVFFLDWVPSRTDISLLTLLEAGIQDQAAGRVRVGFFWGLSSLLADGHSLCAHLVFSLPMHVSGVFLRTWALLDQGYTVWFYLTLITSLKTIPSKNINIACWGFHAWIVEGHDSIHNSAINHSSLPRVCSARVITKECSLSTEMAMAAFYRGVCPLIYVSRLLTTIVRAKQLKIFVRSLCDEDA